MPRVRSASQVEVEQPSTCGRCLAYCVWKTGLILVSLLCVVCGLVICVSSIWVMADKSFAEGLETEENMQGIRKGAAVLLGSSLVILLISGVGLVGAVIGNPKLLLAFAILVLLILLLPEIALIVWFLTRREDVVEMVDGVVSRNMEYFVRDNEDNGRIFMTNIQKTLHCCGLTGISDYMTDEQRKSCLKDDQETYYIKGCKNVLANTFMNNIIILVVAELCHLIMMILGIVAALKLRNQILSKKKLRSAERESFTQELLEKVVEDVPMEEKTGS